MLWADHNSYAQQAVIQVGMKVTAICRLMHRQMEETS